MLQCPDCGHTVPNPFCDTFHKSSKTSPEELVMAIDWRGYGKMSKRIYDIWKASLPVACGCDEQWICGEHEDQYREDTYGEILSV